MADADLIARVYPPSDRATHEFRVIGASPWSRPPLRPSADAQQTYANRTDREATQGTEQFDASALPYLELRFGDGPRSSSGFVFGKEQGRCDVVLPNWSTISRRHFALTYKKTFDGYKRLIVRDLDSVCGTVVTYDLKGDELRSKFEWIIDGFEIPDYTEALNIKPHDDLSFRVFVNHQCRVSTTYNDNVEQFCQGALGPADLFYGLGLQSGPETERPSGRHTPISNPILLPQGWVSQGEFAVVSRHWNVSSGRDYACKQPMVGPNFNSSLWEKEVDILKRISHEHIVRLFLWYRDPMPRMFLEYMPLGNLEDQHSRSPFVFDECLMILNQCLSALNYLHGRQQPVAHRDIKPSNILVQRRAADRNPGQLHVTLSDFGFSKLGGLKTASGFDTYWPPEIPNDYPAQSSTKAVDIWSLGVVILRFAYALPPPGYGTGIDWCIAIANQAYQWPSDGLINLIKGMVVIDPMTRWSTAICLREAGNLVRSIQGHLATPAPAQYAAGHGATTYPAISRNEFISVGQDLNEQGQRVSESAYQAIEGAGAGASAEAVVQRQGANAQPSQHPGSQSDPCPVMRDRVGYLYVRISGGRVSMRTSDYHINASELASAAGLDRTERDRRLRNLRRRTTSSLVGQRVWVPFEYGALFCRELNLENQMRELLSYAPQNHAASGSGAAYSGGNQELGMHGHTRLQVEPFVAPSDPRQISTASNDHFPVANTMGPLDAQTNSQWQPYEQGGFTNNLPTATEYAGSQVQSGPGVQYVDPNYTYQDYTASMGWPGQEDWTRYEGQ